MYLALTAGFRHEVDENCALLGGGNSLQTFRDNNPQERSSSNTTFPPHTFSPFSYNAHNRDPPKVDGLYTAPTVYMCSVRISPSVNHENTTLPGGQILTESC